MLNLQTEVTDYTDKNGQAKKYTNLYVLVAGVKVQVKAVDRTGQQLIQNALDSNK
jgi:hypothetical protein